MSDQGIRYILNVRYCEMYIDSADRSEYPVIQINEGTAYDIETTSLDDDAVIAQLESEGYLVGCTKGHERDDIDLRTKVVRKEYL
jgi:hypothetical protein